MKSRIISAQNKNSGFLLPEMIIAFSLLTLFLTSTITLYFSIHYLREDGIRHLDRLKQAISNIASLSEVTYIPYGNDSVRISSESLTLLRSDYANALGRDSCDIVFNLDLNNANLITGGLYLGSGNISTDIEVRNSIVYMTADSSISSAPDFYIIDMTEPHSPSIISSLNTGPGLSALEVVGPYVYTINKGTTNQLQVIDIHDMTNPILITKYKLPLPTASTTPPIAQSLFYSNGLIYLGTEKWNAGEFAIIDVSNPINPLYIGGLELGTLVRDIYVRNGQAYIATAGNNQLLNVRVSDPTLPTIDGNLSPSGWQTQTGQTLTYFEGIIGFGRTTGGFNLTQNHEIFTLGTTSLTINHSHDIPGGVYGILIRPPYIYLATRSIGNELQIWKDDFSTTASNISLGFQPEAMKCDGTSLYFATGNSLGVAILENT